MSVIDIATLLAPVSAESPCGEDLAGERLLLDAETQPRPDPEDPHRSLSPDWIKARKLAEEHLARSKDLKVAVVLTQALIETAGLAGFGDGLSLLRELLEQYWEGLYPPIDEDGDPFERAMALQALADTYVDGQDASDSLGMVAFAFRRLPLVRLRGLGEYTLRDYKLAHRQWRFFVKADHKPPTTSEIDGAFKDCELSELQATGEILQQAETDLGAMEIFLKQQVTEDTPTFQQLLREIADARKVVEQYLLKRGGMSVADTLPEDASAAMPGQGGPTGGDATAVTVTPAQAGVATPGEIRGRDDVVETLERLCEYYERHEPSSPLPLLLNRAKRLVNMDFMAILEDMASAGLDQARMIQGSADTPGSGGEGSEESDSSSSW